MSKTQRNKKAKHKQRRRTRMKQRSKRKERRKTKPEWNLCLPLHEEITEDWNGDVGPSSECSLFWQLNSGAYWFVCLGLGGISSKAASKRSLVFPLKSVDLGYPSLLLAKKMFLCCFSLPSYIEKKKSILSIQLALIFQLLSQSHTSMTIHKMGFRIHLIPTIGEWHAPVSYNPHTT